MWNMMFCQQKALFSLGFMIAGRLCSDKNSLRALWLTWWNRWSVRLLAHINRYSDAQGPVNALAQKPLKSYFCCGRKYFLLYSGPSSLSQAHFFFCAGVFFRHIELLLHCNINDSELRLNSVFCFDIFPKSCNPDCLHKVPSECHISNRQSVYH